MRTDDLVALLTELDTCTCGEGTPCHCCGEDGGDQADHLARESLRRLIRLILADPWLAIWK